MALTASRTHQDAVRHNAVTVVITGERQANLRHRMNVLNDGIQL